MSVTILHLSDLHVGPGELRDEDLKQVIPSAERARLIDRLTTYLRAIDKPDYVVISGDFTNAGNSQGLQDAFKWISDRIEEGTFPGRERIIVTPGNHDVKWGVEEKPGWHAERYAAFFSTLGRAFPHAYLPDCDPPLDSDKPTITKKAIHGGITTKLKLGQPQVLSSHPFLLDLERKILLFAFNSSLACGVSIRAPMKIMRGWENLLELYRERPEVGNRLSELLAAYKASLLIDGGLIGDQQLEYFADLMRRLKKILGSHFDRLTKLAILHHHIGHLWKQQLEVKTFETVIDAAQLKQRLIEFGFDMVLHGHKHKNHVGLDSTVIPVSSARTLNPLCIISGGTVCGYPPLGDRQTFKIISIDDDAQRRTHATISEIPLEDTGDPSTIIVNSSVFNVPLVNRSPEVHEFSDWKAHLDELLISKYVEPVAKKHRGILSRGQVMLPTLNSSILSQQARYRCALSVDVGTSKWLFEIILATKRLDFSQRARLHWLLSDVAAYMAKHQVIWHINLIIGDLGSTHFSQTKHEHEIRESVETIRQWFAPAIKSRLFTIRAHTFSQSELEFLSASIARKLARTRSN